jgi:hypothetical protein
MPDAEWARLVQLIKATGSDTGALLKHYGVNDLKRLSHDQWADAIDKLNAKLAKAAKSETDTKAQTETKSGFGEILDDEIPY